MNCYGRMNDAELDESLIPRDRERTSAHRLGIGTLLPGGGANLRTPPPSPPRGVNFLLGGSDPPPKGVNLLLGGPDPLSKRFLGDFQRFMGDLRPISSDFEG